MRHTHPKLTPEFLEEWARKAVERRLKLHFQMASPAEQDRDMAFTQMSHLAHEAVTLLRLISTQLDSQPATAR